MRARNRWGWGFEDAAFSTADARAAAPGLVGLLGFGETEPEEPVPFDPSALPARRVASPPHLDGICTADPAIRAAHARGQSYLDTVHGLRGRYEHVPDVVARPRDTREIEDVLEWAGAANAAVIPYGGGTSVVGGVEPRVPDHFDGAVTIDLGAIDKLREVDEVSRAARIGAGASGPRIEEQLAAYGLTLRFFPQSFELSTLGGWIATRAGGHFATHLTHIDDLVESVRAVGPAGDWVSRRLPGSGAGPSPDRMLLGSEGILGIITEAWVRVRPRPVYRAGARGALRLVPRRRGGRSRARPVRARAGQLPPHRRARGGAVRRRRRPGRAAHARLRVRRPSGRAVARARARDLPGARRRLGRGRRRGGIGRRHRLVARGVPPHAVPPRPARAPRASSPTRSSRR